jgi:hypothetical protein
MSGAVPKGGRLAARKAAKRAAEEASAAATVQGGDAQEQDDGAAEEQAPIAAKARPTASASPHAAQLGALTHADTPPPHRSSRFRRS